MRQRSGCPPVAMSPWQRVWMDGFGPRSEGRFHDATSRIVPACAEKRKSGAENRAIGAEKRKSGAEKRKSGAEKRNCTLGPPYQSTLFPLLRTPFPLLRTPVFLFSAPLFLFSAPIFLFSAPLPPGQPLPPTLVAWLRPPYHPSLCPSTLPWQRSDGPWSFR